MLGRRQHEEGVMTDEVNQELPHTTLQKIRDVKKAAYFFPKRDFS